jgi:hypothetical protein
MTTAPRWRWKSLAEQHGIAISRETLRQWLIEAKLWRSRRAQVKQVHVWRTRRARFGELVQWDCASRKYIAREKPKNQQHPDRRFTMGVQ